MKRYEVLVWGEAFSVGQMNGKEVKHMERYEVHANLYGVGSSWCAKQERQGGQAHKRATRCAPACLGRVLLGVPNCDSQAKHTKCNRGCKPTYPG
eukprot:1158783-Pelagomonas_calceolata.AAC.3